MEMSIAVGGPLFFFFFTRVLYPGCSKSSFWRESDGVYAKEPC
jgi:hypothetical protein